MLSDLKYIVYTLDMPLLYKYRTLDNWRFFLDIVVNRRLFAASYLDLNDPMEGYYQYASDKVLSDKYSEAIQQDKEARQLERELTRKKRLLRICSLSEEPRSTLMWSYYAGGHTGVAIGINSPTRHGGRRVEPVFYDNTMKLQIQELEGSIQDVAVKILTRKLYSWRHEAEHRVFTEKDFIPVTIKEVMLGCKISDDDKKMVHNLVEKFCPDADVHKLKRSELRKDYP